MTQKVLCFISVIFISHFAKGQQDTTAIPKQDSVFEKVDVKASFKGGREAWAKFIENKMVYPGNAYRNKIQGQVVVRFVIEEDGSVKEVMAMYGPNELRHEAVRIVEKSPKWIPAQKNGKNVKSFISQPINFSIL